MEEKIALVIIAYNRPNSLKRLLKSIELAEYKNSKLSLYLIIDKDLKKSSSNQEVIKIAKDFSWKHGRKMLVLNTENKGLRKNILESIDFIKEDYFVMLEDDLVVSPYYFQFCKNSLELLNNDKIEGISLYTHPVNQTANLPFDFLIKESGFYMQYPSSWGFLTSKKKWLDFKEWILLQDSIKINTKKIPLNIKLWKESSWLKYYIKYIVDNNRFYYYSVNSYSTNMSDNGTHAKKSMDYQTKLYMSNKKEELSMLNTAIKYDCYFEIFPEVLKEECPHLKKFNSITVDLYGTKPLDEIETKYILSSKYCSNPIYSYEREYKPHEMNVVLENYARNGKIFFGEKKYFLETNRYKNILNNYEYYIGDLYSKKKLIYLFLQKIFKGNK